jgi:Uma2 family endonuclease
VLHHHPTRLTLEEYLAWEARQETRNELVDGQPVAMTGGSRRHGRITRNLTVLLERQLAGGPCEAFATDCKVKTGVGEDSNVRYPDAVVDCGGRGDSDDDRVQLALKPVLVAEVLSPSNREGDQLQRLRDYDRTPSIQHYLVVAQSQVSVTVYSRQGGELSPAHLYEALTDVIDLPELGLTIALADVYLNLAKFAPAPPD